MSTTKRFVRAIILGAPGGGKGTISSKLVQDFNFLHISTGDLLREHVTKQTELGKQAKSFMTAGQFVPDALVLNMLEERLHGIKDRNLLVDGTPRNLSQAQSLKVFCPIDMVIALEVPHETIIQRISSRWVHLPSGRTYNTDYKPPKTPGKDDVTGESLQQRDDDKADTVRARLDAYEKMSRPLVEYYAHQDGIELQRFNGTESDKIYPHVRDFVSKSLGGP